MAGIYYNDNIMRNKDIVTDLQFIHFWYLYFVFRICISFLNFVFGCGLNFTEPICEPLTKCI